MTPREVIARTLHRADVEPRRFDPDWNVREWDELSDPAKVYWYRLAEAAMPIMRKALFVAAVEGWAARVRSDRGLEQSVEAIVARIMSEVT